MIIFTSRECLVLFKYGLEIGSSDFLLSVRDIQVNLRWPEGHKNDASVEGEHLV